MINEKKLESLFHNDTYFEFLDEVYMMRESLIHALHDASLDKLQQISGRILQCDEILDLGGYSNMVKRKSIGKQ